MLILPSFHMSGYKVVTGWFYCHYLSQAAFQAPPRSYLEPVGGWGGRDDLWGGCRDTENALKLMAYPLTLHGNWDRVWLAHSLQLSLQSGGRCFMEHTSLAVSCCSSDLKLIGPQLESQGVGGERASVREKMDSQVWGQRGSLASL